MPALSVVDAGKQMALRDAVAFQLVSHDHPRHILQTLQQSSEETLGSVGITPLLNQNVEQDADLIHRAPEIVLHALDSDEDLIEVPLVPGPWPAMAQAAGKRLAKFLAPAPHGLIGDYDAPLGQKQFDVPQAEAEHVIQPDCVANDLRGEAMAVAWVGGGFMPPILSVSALAAQAGYRDNASREQRRDCRVTTGGNAVGQTEANPNPSPQRVIRPDDGDEKCAVQTSVDVSHRSPNNFRRDAPACGES
jgi:hypothetical protein